MFNSSSKHIVRVAILSFLSCNLTQTAPVTGSAPTRYESTPGTTQSYVYDKSREQELEESALFVKRDMLRDQFKETSSFSLTDWFDGTILRQYFLPPTKEEQLEAYRVALELKDPELAQAIGTAGYQLDWTKWPIRALTSRGFYRIFIIAFSSAILFKIGGADRLKCIFKYLPKP